MKIKAYKATKEKKIHLKLNETALGIDVVVVNDDGSLVIAGNLLTIEPEGVRLHPRVSKSIGLPLDTEGAVISLYGGKS